MKHYLSSAVNYVFRTRPFDVTVFLTSSCNFRCGHCFYWKKPDNKEELSLDEFMRVARSMPLLERLQFTGGEPFLRKDIDLIVGEFYRRSRPMYITIPTNGYFTDRIVEKTESIVKSAPECFVNISLQLNDIGTRRDESVKVKGSFERLVDTVNELNRLKSKLANLGVTVICIQTSENEDNIQRVYDFAMSELRVDNFGYSIVRGDPRASGTKDIDYEIYHQMCHKLLESYKHRYAGSRIPLYKLFLTNRELVYDNTYKTLVQNRFQLKCFAGILRAVILENGQVYPCEILMENGSEFSMGNLRDFDLSFKNLWRSARRSDINRKISEQKCFCTHGCDMMVNTLFSRKFPFQVAKRLLKLGS